MFSENVPLLHVYTPSFFFRQSLVSLASQLDWVPTGSSVITYKVSAPFVGPKTQRPNAKKWIGQAPLLPEIAGICTAEIEVAWIILLGAFSSLFHLSAVGLNTALKIAATSKMATKTVWVPQSESRQAREGGGRGGREMKRKETDAWKGERAKGTRRDVSRREKEWGEGNGNGRKKKKEFREAE